MTDATDPTNSAASTATGNTTREVEKSYTAVASKALDKTREGAVQALDTTRETVRGAATRTAEAVHDNPLPVLIGGLAIGALAATFLPRTAREAALLGPLGKRLTDTASGAVKAARDAGKAEFDGLGLSRDAARDQAGKLVGGVLKALATAGMAAATASRAGSSTKAANDASPAKD